MSVFEPLERFPQWRRVLRFRLGTLKHIDGDVPLSKARKHEQHLVDDLPAVWPDESDEHRLKQSIRHAEWVIRDDQYGAF